MLTQPQIDFFTAFGHGANASSSPGNEFARIASIRNWKMNSKTYCKHWTALLALPTSNNAAPDSESDSATDSDSYDFDSLTAQLSGLALTPSTNANTNANANIKVNNPTHASTTGTVQAAFAQIASARNLKKNSSAYYTQYARFLSDEIRKQYGTDDVKLPLLQEVCKDAGVKDIPTSIKQCKKALSHRHINIHDFLNCKRAGTKVKPVFRNYPQFCAYMKEGGEKIFPKKFAKESTVLRVLLREIR